MRRTRGYTLVELMVVVVIASVLVLLATFGVRKYLYAAKTSEAIHMINSIAAAQEAYRTETGAYLQVSTGINSYYPQNATPGRTKWNWGNPAHPDFQRWSLLGATTDTPVQFGYVSVSGVGPTVPATGAESFPAFAPTSAWTLIKAAADQNGDGNLSYFILLRGEGIASNIYSENEAE